MNIIISKDKSIRLTQYSSQSTYELTDINFYISNELNDITPSIKLKYYRNTYPFSLKLSGIATNYNIYKIMFTQPVSLSANTYNLFVELNDKDLAVNDIKLNEINYTATETMLLNDIVEDGTDPSIYPYGLSDDHEPIEIIDRTIVVTKNQNILIAEDNISQCIRFRLPRYYDGVDLYDKNFYIDYVKDGALSNLLIPKEWIDLETVDAVAYIILKWAVSNKFTKEAGALPFAISATDLGADSGSGESFEPKKQYVWQTEPAKLVIKANLGPRNSSTTEEEEPDISNDIQVLAKRVEENSQAISSIQQSDIYNLDNADPTDGSVLISGGGAIV